MYWKEWVRGSLIAFFFICIKLSLMLIFEMKSDLMLQTGNRFYMHKHIKIITVGEKKSSNTLRAKNTIY